MNRIRSVIYTSFRTYARTARGSRGKRRNAAAAEKADFELTKEELQEFEEYESDLMNVGQCYNEFQEEQRIGKQKLINQIVAKKYFKEDPDPAFLTFIERDEIKRLHKKDPEEWTVERLSESFPALPMTIKKILKSKWIPESVEKVIKYDSEVIENWKKFNAGKLAVSPILKKHLMKFEGRKISMTRREVLAEKIVRKPAVFAKPKSSLYSSIITSYVDATQSDTSNQKMLPTKKSEIPKSMDEDKIKQKYGYHTNTDNLVKSYQEENKETTSIVSKYKNDLVEDSTNNLVTYNQKIQLTHKREKFVTFNTFAKSKLQELYKSAPIEGATLINAYKKYLDTYEQNTKETKDIDDQLEILNKENPPQTSNANTNNKISKADMQRMKSTNMLKTEMNLIKNEKKSKDLEEEDESDLSVSTKVKTNTLSVNVDDHRKTSLETYVKEWNKSIEEGEYFDDYIKIPKKLYKPGKLYRIKDCYYDDDGEFLYRVPGLRN